MLSILICENLKKLFSIFILTMKEVLSTLVFNERGKAHRLPRLFENRRDEGRTGSGAR